MKATPMYMLISKSANHKTGKMAVSTSPHNTCPTSCPFKCNGCYAASGPIALWWKRCSESAESVDPQAAWKKFCKKVSCLDKGSILRHNQAGDLVPVDTDNPIEICAAAAADLAASCVFAGVRAYTYTHYPVLYGHGCHEKVVSSNRQVIEDMNDAGFVVNISANSPSHADAIMDSGLKAPVTTLVKSDTIGHNLKTPAGRPIVVCPAMWRKEMTCDKCKGCMNASRKTIIAFPSHGTCKKRCDAVIDQWELKHGNV